jgi:hypothetical protein
MEYIIVSDTFRRHRDGSIDFDFYRAQAIALRKQAIYDALKLKAMLNFALIMLALIVAVTFAASTTNNWI